MKLKILMCEGAHDIGFISKILLANEYKTYDKKIKDYPIPLNKQIEQNMIRESVGDCKLGFQSSYMVPFASYCSNDTLILLHNMGGDKTIDARYKLIEDYNVILEAIKDDTIGLKQEISEIEYFLFFDSDDMGIQGRIDDIRSLFANRYGIPEDEIIHGERNKNGEITLGTYIFHDVKSEEKKGTLEDQLINLVSFENEAIVNIAKQYLNDNSLKEERTKEYLVDKDKYKGQSKYEQKKSLVSVMGQLQFSGSNNSVIIAKSDYIKKSMLLVDDECKIIFELLDQ